MPDGFVFVVVVHRAFANPLLTYSSSNSSPPPPHSTFPQPKPVQLPSVREFLLVETDQVLCDRLTKGRDRRGGEVRLELVGGWSPTGRRRWRRGSSMEEAG